jgi:hypothetical protein
MAEPDTKSGKLYTLSEISKKTSISMPTLQRYKKLYQERLPSVGKGRKQRYPESALPVFAQIKTENAGKRGRPRKNAAAAARPAASKRRGRPPAVKPAAAAPGRRRGRKPGARRGRPPGAVKTARRGRPRKSAGGLLTLTEISRTTGISYPTLVRYVRLYSDRLAHEGAGRARRFYPQAVDVFRQLRSESGRGGRRRGASIGRRGGRAAGTADASLAKRLKQIERTQQDLDKKFKGFVKNLQKLFR